MRIEETGTISVEISGNEIPVLWSSKDPRLLNVGPACHNNCSLVNEWLLCLWFFFNTPYKCSYRSHFLAEATWPVFKITNLIQLLVLSNDLLAPKLYAQQVFSCTPKTHNTTFCFLYITVTVSIYVAEWTSIHLRPPTHRFTATSDTHCLVISPNISDKFGLWSGIYNPQTSACTQQASNAVNSKEW